MLHFKHGSLDRHGSLDILWSELLQNTDLGAGNSGRKEIATLLVMLHQVCAFLCSNKICRWCQKTLGMKPAVIGDESNTDWSGCSNWGLD